MYDVRMVDLTRRCKPLLFAFYICCFVLVNKHVLQVITGDSIHSKVMRGSQNFEIRSRDPGHAQLRIVLWSGRSRGPPSMSVPYLKRITLFVQKL